MVLADQRSATVSACNLDFLARHAKAEHWTRFACKSRCPANSTVQLLSWPLQLISRDITAGFVVKVLGQFHRWGLQKCISPPVSPLGNYVISTTNRRGQRLQIGHLTAVRRLRRPCIVTRTCSGTSAGRPPSSMLRIELSLSFFLSESPFGHRAGRLSGSIHLRSTSIVTRTCSGASVGHPAGCMLRLAAVTFLLYHFLLKSGDGETIPFPLSPFFTTIPLSPRTLA